MDQRTLSRRRFLRTSSAGAAAGLIGASGVLSRAAAASERDAEANDPIGAADDRVVAFVRAGDRHEVTVLIGDREVVRRDPRLARMLLRAAR
jgi:anaerobic selenocysteine-containing dehydrogenase